MNRKPLVSGIIIFLNAEKFIEEAIESVFTQTYVYWELLLVDDGSSDGSTAIALRYAQQYPDKVRYLEHDGHQNRGMSATRNLGIRNAKGEYIAFLDADDVWLPLKLEQQVAILSSQPEAGMLYGLSQYWYSWTGNPKDIKSDYVEELGVQPNTLLQPPTLLTLFFLHQEAAIPCPSDILVRREVIERVGGFEEGFISIYQSYEDQAFYAKVCLQSPVFASGKCWDRYRQHPDSCCSVVQKTGEENATRLFFLNWLEEYLSKQGVKDTEVWKLLRRQLLLYRYPKLDRLLKRSQYLVRQMKGLVKQIGRRTLLNPSRRWLQERLQGHEYRPPVGWARFGSFRRLTPLSREFGYDRGLPIDRYYIENFLARHAGDIQGHVLEVADATYTLQFGGEHVTCSNVLHVVAGNPEATIVGDLTSADHIPSDAFDCVILTQTLPFIYDVRAALKTLIRILKPGGVVLVTFPGISQISRDDMEQWGHYWSFTTLSAQRLFEEFFPTVNLQVETCGNVLTAIAFLQGLAVEELSREQLEYRDRDYEVLITVRAVKPEVTR